MSAYFSHLGSNSAPYTTWATAATDLNTAILQEGAGGEVFADNTTVLSPGATYSLATAAGALNNPCVIYSVDRTGDPEPPTAVTAGCTVVTGANQDIVFDSGLVFDGFTFQTGDDLVLSATSNVVFRNCVIWLSGLSSADRIFMFSDNTHVIFDRCAFRFGNAGQQMRLGGGSRGEFRSCSLDPGTAAITQFFEYFFSRGAFIEIYDGFDFTNAGAGFHLVSVTTTSQSGSIRGHGIQLPAGGDWVATDPIPIDGFELHVTASGPPDNRITDASAMSLGRTLSNTAVTAGSAFSHGATATARTIPAICPQRFLISEGHIDAANPTITVYVAAEQVLTDHTAWIEIIAPDTSGTRTQMFSSQGPTLGTPTTLTVSAQPWSNPPSNVYEITVGTTNTVSGNFQIYGCYAPAAAETSFWDPTPGIA